MMILADFSHTLLSAATDVWNYVLLAIGFGFVIFFHELGHFLAAKYSGVKVEQFAVGFGPAVLAWRKGVGFRYGTTTPEFERRVTAHLESHFREELQFKDGVTTAAPQQIDKAMEELGLSETEYRLNWIPLGGYVKMLGQDDLKPGATAQDPRAYNNKPIGSRMLIVSAGVVMNIILAAVGFMIVFLLGFKAPPPQVGGIMGASPATMTADKDGRRKPLVVGDRILSLDGKQQLDFTKVALTVALVEEGKSVPIVVRHRDQKPGESETLYVTPAKQDGDAQGFLQLGVLPPMELKGLDPSEKVEEDLDHKDLYPADAADVKPGDVITAINGAPVPPADDKHDYYWMLDQAVANSDGAPVKLTVKGSDGREREEKLTPRFQAMFSGNEDLNFLGMVPRAQVHSLLDESPARKQVRPGDVIEVITSAQTHGSISNPSRKALIEALNTAGQQDQKVVLTLRNPGDARSHDSAPIVPSLQLSKDRRGLGVQLDYDVQSTVVAEVQPNSPAASAGVGQGWAITKINGVPVHNWFQVRRQVINAKPGEPMAIDATTKDGPQSAKVTLSQDQIDSVKYLTFTNDLVQVLHERTELRKTTNPLTAAHWGVIETRDFVLQFYLTIQRMIGGSVSPRQAMGPVGIFRYGAKFAGRGTDWLIWFLAMISANLAVVNFLPIPVVDGGQFVFLLLEKIQGRPLSSNAQKVIQVVGLALILGVFLFVTYQDIARMFGRA